jgi:DNA polymerase
MHVHDEVVAEVDCDSAEDALEEISKIMAEPILWAPGLPLKADGYTTEFYKKDD